MSESSFDSQFGWLTVLEVYHYYDGPRFFLATSVTGALYVFLWFEKPTDGRADWLAMPISRSRLHELRTGTLDIRSAFLASEDRIIYKVRTTADTAMVLESLKPSNLMEDWLPDPGERLSVPEPMALFEEDRPEQLVTYAKESRRNILIVRLEPPVGFRSGIAPIELVGTFLRAFQIWLLSLVSAVRRSASETLRKHISLSAAKDEVRLNAIATAPGSFKVQIESFESSVLFGPSIAELVIARGFGILNAGSDEGSLRTAFGGLLKSSTSSYKNLLASMEDLHYGAMLQWAGPVEGQSMAYVTSSQAGVIMRVLDLMEPASEDELVLQGYLEAADRGRHVFKFKGAIVDGDHPIRVYQGQFTQDLLARVPLPRIGGYYEVVLLRKTSLATGTGQEFDEFEMLDMVEMLDPADGPLA